jgi:hypothetical protein
MQEMGTKTQNGDIQLLLLFFFCVNISLYVWYMVFIHVLNNF